MKPFITVFSGKNVNPLDLRPEDVNPLDIAHALSNVNRFTGHARRPISVGQHSVYVSRLVTGTGFELQGLLHDASEAYLGDVSKWLKQTDEMAKYREVEERVQRVIFKRFGCDPEQAECVTAADKLMVRYEGKQAFGWWWKVGHPDYPEGITIEETTRIGEWNAWYWVRARGEWIDRFNYLTGSNVCILYSAT